MESRSVDAPYAVELDVSDRGWKIGVLIRYPCDIMIAR
jgi:hypothetical protein